MSRAWQGRRQFCTDFTRMKLPGRWVPYCTVPYITGHFVSSWVFRQPFPKSGQLFHIVSNSVSSFHFTFFEIHTSKKKTTYFSSPRNPRNLQTSSKQTTTQKNGTCFLRLHCVVRSKRRHEIRSRRRT